MLDRFRDTSARFLDMPVRVSASGPASITTAWQRYADFELWPTWSPQLRRVETAAGRLAPASTGRVIGPLGLSAEFTVSDVDESRHRWNWTVQRGPLTLRLEHGLDVIAENDSEAGTRAWLVLHGPAPILLGYAPLAWYALHRLVTLPQ